MSQGCITKNCSETSNQQYSVVLPTFRITGYFADTSNASSSLISRPTPRLLSFVLCLEWINGTYSTIHSRHSIDTPHTVECYRPHGWVGTTTPVQSIASTSMVENCHKYAHENAVKLVNKRPRNLLNEIQNVFINGKQVKTAKITQIIPWFSQFYSKTTTGNSHAHMYAPTVTSARWRSVCEFATSAHGALRLQPTNRAVKLGRPVGRRHKPDYVITYSYICQ